MIRLESITIKEFRGIRDMTLDFKGKNFAICGPNGTVPSAPGAAGVRVWEVMSRGRGPRVGRPPPEGVNVAYALVPHNALYNYGRMQDVWLDR